MIKNITIVEVEIGERSYQLHCSPESPLGELYDAIQKLGIVIVERMMEEQKKLQKPVEDDKSIS